MKILLDTTSYVGFKRGTEEGVDFITSAELVLFSPIFNNPLCSNIHPVISDLFTP